MGHAKLGRQVAGLDEDGHGSVVDVGRDVFGAAGHGFQGGVGVVDDDVEAAPTINGGLDHGLDLVELTDVGGAGGGDAAGVLNPGRALLGALGVDVGDEDGGAFGCEAFGDGAADAGGAAGDEPLPGLRIDELQLPWFPVLGYGVTQSRGPACGQRCERIGCGRCWRGADGGCRG